MRTVELMEKFFDRNPKKEEEVCSLATNVYKNLRNLENSQLQIAKSTGFGLRAIKILSWRPLD